MVISKHAARPHTGRPDCDPTVTRLIRPDGGQTSSEYITRAAHYQAILGSGRGGAGLMQGGTCISCISTRAALQGWRNGCHLPFSSRRCGW